MSYDPKTEKVMQEELQRMKAEHQSKVETHEIMLKHNDQEMADKILPSAKAYELLIAAIEKTIADYQELI